MKFNVEIDMNQFIDGYGNNNYFDDEMFANDIKDRIAEHIVNTMGGNLRYEIGKIADEFIKNEYTPIKEKVIKIVTDKMLRKRDLRELCTSDPKNKQFIEEVVSDCLKKSDPKNKQFVEEVVNDCLRKKLGCQ